METLWKPLEELNAYGSARECIERGRMPIRISGCIDGQKSHLVSGLSQEKSWTVIITANEKKAREILADYRMYDKNAVFYPAKDVIFYSADVHGNAVETERLKTIKLLLDQEGGTVITTMTAGMEYVQSLSVYKKSCRRLQEGAQIDLEDLSRCLTDMGYERQSQVEQPGQYSIRGGIVDLYSPTEECPYRIELWGDEIDTIRSFDVESQRSIERVEQITIFPAMEIILNDAQLRQGFAKIKKDRDKLQAKFKKAGDFEAYNRLADTMREWKERVEYSRSGAGLESFLTYFDGTAGSFFDFFDPEETLFAVDEPVRCLEAMQAVETEFRESMENRLEKGLLLPGQMEVLYSAETVNAMLQQKKTVYLSMLDGLPAGVEVKESLHLQCQTIASYNKHFELLVEDMKRKNGEVFSSFVTMDKVTGGLQYTRHNPETGEIYIPKEICNVQLTPEDKETLRKGQAVYLENMIGRTGEEFSSFVKLDMNTGRTMYSRTPDGFNEQQAPRIPAEVYGHVFTAQERANLQDGKTILVEGLKNNGQSFSSYLKVNPYSGQLQYFQENPDIRRDTSRRAAQTETAQGQQQEQKKGASQAV